MFLKLETLKLTSDQKAHFITLMVAASTVIIKHHELAKVLRKHYSRRAFRRDLFKAIDNGGNVNIAGCYIPPRDIATIQALRAVEVEILQGYDKAILKLAMGWCKKTNKFEHSDLYNEGIIIMLDCIYGFNKPSIKFITYLYTSLNRRFRFLLMAQHYPLSSNIEKITGLQWKYEEMCKTFSGAVSFETVVAKMNITKNDAKILRESFQGLYNSTDMVNKFPKNFLAEVPEIKHGGEYGIEHNEIIDKINSTLFGLELAVWAAMVECYDHGWQAELARNCNVTRQAIDQAVNRVRVKAQRYFRQVA